MTVDDISFQAFTDELTKSAGLGDIWRGFLDLFRSKDDRIQRKVDYHFSPRAGNEKWNKFVRNVRDPSFVTQLAAHPEASSKLQMHAQSMHDLSRGQVAGKVFSSRMPGQSYEIKKLPDDKLGCTCGDWRFKGSVQPGYECKHIVAFKEGKVVAS